MTRRPDHDDIIPAIDVVLLTLHAGALHVLVVRRDRAPFEGELALPGGYIHAQEDDTADDAALRVLKQKAGLVPPYLEQLYTFSGKFRDPRRWSMSVGYFALVSEGNLVVPAGVDAVLMPVDAMRQLPFDHNHIVATAVARVRSKAAYSALPCFLLPEEFTLAALHEVYEQVRGETIDLATFRRRVDGTLVVPIAGKKTAGGAHRPAQLYRAIGH